MLKFFLFLSFFFFVNNFSFVYGFEYKKAQPRYKFNFPIDHASHDDYKTEWWYFTGHLQDDNKHKYGFELTFFRHGLKDKINSKSSIDQNAYMAHFALTDVDNNKFEYTEKLSHGFDGLVFASQKICYVKNENWYLEQLGNNFYISANTSKYSLHLLLEPQKSIVLNGDSGYSQKGSQSGQASYYYSYTRLKATGIIHYKNNLNNVTGLAWMDHEFGTSQLSADQNGWDWFSIQLDDNSEIMLYLMRKNNNTYDLTSSGTYIASDGSLKHLSLNEYKIQNLSFWQSSKTNSKYPSSWKINIPKLKIDLNITPKVLDQELKSKNGVSYWEGACSVNGVHNDKKITGQSYVELTGYSKSANLHKI